MARNVTRSLRDERQKNLVKIFNEACYRHSRWQVWADFVVMAAISISNTIDKSNADSRESTYMTLASKYNQRELDCFCRMLAEIVAGIDECPDQDFLGELYTVYDASGKAVYPAPAFQPYKVKVDVTDLRIRTGPGTNYPTTGQTTGKGVFTITEESAGQGSTAGWGHLKSGAGWISLDYTTKV